MEDVLFIDDCTVATKESMIKYLKKTIEELKEQEDFDNIKDAENLINDISKNAYPFSLIKIAEHVMGGIYWCYVDVVEIEEEEKHFV